MPRPYHLRRQESLKKVKVKLDHFGVRSCILPLYIKDHFGVRSCILPLYIKQKGHLKLGCPFLSPNCAKPPAAWSVFSSRTDQYSPVGLSVLYSAYIVKKRQSVLLAAVFYKQLLRQLLNSEFLHHSNQLCCHGG